MQTPRRAEDNSAHTVRTSSPFDQRIEKAERDAQLARARLDALLLARDLFRADAERRADADAPLEAEFRSL